VFIPEFGKTTNTCYCTKYFIL